ncbi:DNA independent RNA polymerase I transcription factor [Lecanora helva]
MSPMLPVVGSAASTPTAKVPLRRSALVRKREDDDEETPSSPSKKSRVSFDSDVEVRMVEDWEQSPEFIHNEVRRALANRAVGDSAGYDKIKAVFSVKKNENEETSPKVIRHYTNALLANVSALSKSNSDLVHGVINSQWLGRQEDYVAVFMRFLANLVSAQGTYLGETIRMLVSNLTAAPPSEGKSTNSPPLSRPTIYARAHKALHYLLQIIPSASRALSSALIDAFPNELDSRRNHIIYVQNLLRLIGYVPELREEVLRLITERLVKIDVQVQLDLQDLADETGEGLVEKIPQFRPDIMGDEEETDSSDDESESDLDEEGDAEAQRTKEIIKNVEKMDAILDILFSHYDQVFTKSTMQDQIASLNILLSHFSTIILPTHRSRHTQFLLFHFAQQSTEHVDAFVGACAQITFDKKQPAMIRQASAAYLASFVARGMHVAAPIVREVFDYLDSELERLRHTYEPSCRGPDLRRYSSFYVLTQAMLYIFCFRWRDLQYGTEDDFNDDEMESYPYEHHLKPGVKEALSANSFSKLNPLKVCSPAIVNEFARLGNHLGVIYLYHLLETNKRVRLVRHVDPTFTHVNRETALSARGDEEQHLDEYFPFDPYHLPKSKRWLAGDYREWVGVPGLDEEEQSASASDEEDSEEEEGTETD